MNSTTYTLKLPWSKPLLTGNQRLHWRTKAQLTRRTRDVVHVLAQQAKLPKDQAKIAVTLHYQPRDNRRRDADNLVWFLKPICDALAAGTARYPGYGMVADDTPDMMVKHMPVIHPAVRGQPGELWLVIEAWPECP